MAKAKSAAKKPAVKKAAPKAKAASKPKAAKRSTKTVAKYEQPGAPWWKKVPLPDVR